MKWRRETKATTGGRHADPVDQADAILWAEDIRLRALMLVWEQEAWLIEARATGALVVTAERAAKWMTEACQVLDQVSHA